MSRFQRTSTWVPGAYVAPATGLSSTLDVTLIWSVAEKQPPAIDPVTVTSTAFPGESNAATAARSNLTVRSAIPSLSKSPIDVGPDGSTATPFSDSDEASMSDAV